MAFVRASLAAVAAALVVAACGGSGPDYSRVVSFGDSLSDVGTYRVGTIAALDQQSGGAGRWTVNGTAGSQVWIERVASAIDAPRLCPAETGLLPNLPGVVGAPVTTQAGCTNYAQGSSRVSSPVGPNAVALQKFGEHNIGLMAKPVKDQLAAHLAASGGRYQGDELVTVLAGANDVFMELALTASVNPNQAVTNVGLAAVELAGLIKSQVLGKGATRVLVLNVPDVSRTPFGRSKTPQIQGLIQTMVKTFNSQLADALKGVGGVLLVDTFSAFDDQISNPAKYGISNATDIACGPNALSASPSEPGSSLVCNGSNLLSGDRSRYLFADGVHPTPYGHQLMADVALTAMDKAGW